MENIDAARRAIRAAVGLVDAALVGTALKEVEQ
jgi:hypothetical protein